MRFEGANGEMVERCRENHPRDAILGEPAEDVETRSVAHLDVEQYGIGFQLGDLRDRLAATARRPDMLHVGQLR